MTHVYAQYESYMRDTTHACVYMTHSCVHVDQEVTSDKRERDRERERQRERERERERMK